MLVEHGRAGEAVGDALDEPEGGEGAEGVVRRLGGGGGDLVADVGLEAGYPDAGHSEAEPAFHPWRGSVMADSLARVGTASQVR
jgi:hypothetical protein